MMKKKIAGLMVAVILVSCVSMAWAENNEGTFNAKYTSKFDYSTSKWMSTATNRAALTFFLMMDFVLETERETKADFLFSPSFVVRTGGSILVIVPYGDDYVLIEYRTLNPEETSYSISEGISTSTVKQALKSMDEVYYENDTDTMYDILEMLGDVIN